MAYEVINTPQRSQAWFTARLGRLCASDAGKMLTGGKEAKTRTALRDRLVAERLTGRAADDGYTNADMERGVELEPVARDAYRAIVEVEVAEVGFVQSALYMAGASPDGVIGDMEGLVEIKCPRTARHLSYCRLDTVPPEHRAQVVHQMWVTGAEWVDFVSFDPLLPKKLQLQIIRHFRDEKEIAEYEKKALAFLAEVEHEVQTWLTKADHVKQLEASL
jgi:putative phage-type endonuclease